MHESETDPANAPGEIRGARRLHEQRIPGRNPRAHALRLHPRATGVRRGTTRRGKR